MVVVVARDGGEGVYGRRAGGGGGGQERSRRRGLRRACRARCCSSSPCTSVGGESIPPDPPCPRRVRIAPSPLPLGPAESACEACWRARFCISNRYLQRRERWRHSVGRRRSEGYCAQMHPRPQWEDARARLSAPSLRFSMSGLPILEVSPNSF